MIIAKLQYHSPSLKVFGGARDVLASDASPQVRQAVQELEEDRRKAQGKRVSKQG